MGLVSCQSSAYAMSDGAMQAGRLLCPLRYNMHQQVTFMATATRPTVTVDEYLHSSYRPDCDYVDGELQERNLGELDHAEVTAALLVWFRSHDREWNIRTVPELRIRVSST